MAAALEMILGRPRAEGDEARRHAGARLRTRESRLAQRFGLSPQQWQEITRGDWPEIAGRWEEPRPQSLSPRLRSRS